MYYTTNPNGAIRYSSNDKALLQLQDPGFNMQETDKNIITAWDGQLYIEGSEPVPPPPSLEEKQAMIVNAVQQHLDAFARTRNYDNIFSAATYASSTNAQFAAEGQYAVEARDLTWAKCYQILNEVMAGQRPEPSLAEIMAQLPILEWPVVTNE